MDAKLTLTIDKSLIEQAKQYARTRGRSLSDIVENYFKMISKDIQADSNELTSTVKSLKGSFHAPADFDYKESLQEQIMKKHL